MALRQHIPLNGVENEKQGRLLKGKPNSIISEKCVTRRPALGEIKNQIGTRAAPISRKPIAVPSVPITKSTNITTHKEVKKITKNTKATEGHQKLVTLKREENVPQRVNSKQTSNDNSKNNLIESSSYSSKHFGLVEEHECDPQLVSEYINDIMSYLRDLEITYAIKEQFLTGHKTTPRMRIVLINWLVDVHFNFRMVTETLHLCVSIIDRYLQKNKTVSRNNLQLVGIAALFVAGKYEEMYVPELGDFVYVCDKMFTRKAIKETELLIIKDLNHSFGKPLSLHFLRRFSKIGNVEAIHHILAKYLLELALMEYELSHIRPSLQAAAASCLAQSVLNEVSDPATVWTRTLVHYSTYSYNDLKQPMKLMALSVLNADTSKYQAIKNKYSSTGHGKISLKPELKGPLVKKIAQVQ